MVSEGALQLRCKCYRYLRTRASEKKVSKVPCSYEVNGIGNALCTRRATRTRSRWARRGRSAPLRKSVG